MRKPHLRKAAPTLPGALAANLAAQRAKVHVAKKQLGLDDATYRAVLHRAAGITSVADAGPSHFDAILAEFRRLGWKAQSATPKGGKAPRRPLSKNAQIRMIYAVWGDISPMLAVGDESALRSFVQRMTKTEANPAGVSAPEFLKDDQPGKVLEGLKAWRARLRKQKAEVTHG